MAERSFWNPMTNWAPSASAGSRSSAARGSTVWDDAGNALLDVSAALWYCNVGHGRAELADAAASQMRELAAYERGVLVRGIRGVALQLSPPFVITEDELATTGRVLGEAVDAVSA